METKKLKKAVKFVLKETRRKVVEDEMHFGFEVIDDMLIDHNLDLLTEEVAWVIEDKIHLLIGDKKIYKCPSCNTLLDKSMVDSTEYPYMMCGECGLIFDNYPKKVVFSHEVD
jgi:rubredoxin